MLYYQHEMYFFEGSSGMKKTVAMMLLCTLFFLFIAACTSPKEPPVPEETCTITFRYPSLYEDTFCEYVKTVPKGAFVRGDLLPGNHIYEFEGWYYNGKKWDFYANPVNEDITLIGYFCKVEYAVHFYVGDYERAELSVFYGDLATDLYAEEPEQFASLDEWKKMTKEGYVFDGWLHDGKKWDFSTDVVTESIELHASFRKAEA